jgi:hypothetical protein
MSLSAVATLPAPRPRVRDIQQVIGNLHRQNPRAPEARLAALLMDELLDDRELLLVIAGDLVRKALAPAKVKPKATLKSAEAARRQRVARQVAAKAEAQAVAGKVKEIILLDTMVMLVTGEQKQLRYATKVELDQLGGLYVKLAARLETPSEMCGERWTEGEVKALLGATPT